MEEINQVNEEVETNEQVETEALETVSKADYDALKAQLEELEGKIPKEPTDAEINLKKREKELFDKEVNLTLKENGFESFAPLIKVQNTDELNSSIKLLQEIYKQNKVNSSYIPSGTSSTNTYDQAKQQGNTKGMIKSLFGF